MMNPIAFQSLVASLTLKYGLSREQAVELCTFIESSGSRAVEGAMADGMRVGADAAKKAAEGVIALNKSWDQKLFEQSVDLLVEKILAEAQTKKG